jgi:hypothetical protein
MFDAFLVAEAKGAALLLNPEISARGSFSTEVTVATYVRRVKMARQFNPTPVLSPHYLASLAAGELPVRSGLLGRARPQVPPRKCPVR